MPREKSQQPDEPPATEMPLYLKELAPISTILADQERRAAERRQGKAAWVHLDDFRDFDGKDFWKQVEAKVGHPLGAKQRIALVIQWFEETSAIDGRLAGLLRPYRDEAVEPLLDCLQHDRRLSRGGEGETLDYETGLETVDKVAYETLCALLETRFEINVGNTWIPQSRKDLAERIRAHWRKMKNNPATANSPNRQQDCRLSQRPEARRC